MKNKKYLLMIIFILFFKNLTFGAISDEELNKIEEYDGPQVESKDIEIIYSEKAKLKARIVANIAQQFKNKNIVYPQGISVEFYDDEGKIKGSLIADYVEYIHKENIYYIRKIDKDIIVKNNKNEILKTTELMWLPDEKKIKTERFVEIYTKDVSLIGKGIDAIEDFSEYTILEPHGSIEIKKEDKSSQTSDEKQIQA